MRLFFEGRHELLDTFIGQSSRLGQVFVFQNEKYEPPKLGLVNFIPIQYGTFGLGYLFKWFNFDITTPSYIKQYDENISKLMPTHIIIFDFFRFSFWQALAYKKKYPNTKLYLFSETKRWPVRYLTRLVMKIFFWRFKKNIQHIEKILVWTEQGRGWFAKNLPDKKVELVPAPVDTDLFVPNARKTWVPNGMLRILMNARYSPYKHHEDLLQALLVLQERGQNVHLSLIGRADAGKVKLRKRVIELGLESVVTFLDTVPHTDMPAIYNQHDILVLPSYNEAIGMVVPEAMACGLPTITSDTVGANVYVKEGVTGLIFKTGDTNDLVKKLEQCFEAGKLERMGKIGRVEICEKHSLKVAQQRFLDAIL